MGRKPYHVDGWNPAPVEVGSWHPIIYEALATSKRWFSRRISGCHQQYVYEKTPTQKNQVIYPIPSMYGIYNLHLVEFHGFHLGKYTIYPMYPMGKKLPYGKWLGQIHLLGTLVELIKRGPYKCFLPHPRHQLNEQQPYIHASYFVVLMKIYVWKYKAWKTHPLNSSICFNFQIDWSFPISFTFSTLTNRF